ncbi:MAG: ATP-binding protein [Sandaracinaceae bacterium]
MSEHRADGPAVDREAVLEALPTAVVVTTLTGRIAFANRRATEILGRDTDEILGQHVDTVLGPTLHADGERGIRRLATTGRVRRLGYAEELLETGETVIAFHDVSPVMDLREERDRLMRLAAIGEAMPSLLHELKNPLAAAMTAIEVLLEDLPEGSTQEQLYAVLLELRRMKLGFEGVGAVHGELRSPRQQPIDFACQEVCRVLAARASRQGVYLRAEIDTLPLLPLDASVVRAVLFNFVTNALHACEPGAAVFVWARYDDGVFELASSDTGTGMSPETADRATDLFFTTKPSGSGIGLALCRRVVEGAGGSLEVQSVPGFGTTVRARVPIAPSSRGLARGREEG